MIRLRKDRVWLPHCDEKNHFSLQADWLRIDLGRRIVEVLILTYQLLVLWAGRLAKSKRSSSRATAPSFPLMETTWRGAARAEHQSFSRTTGVRAQVLPNR
jgi:hypothetical protein